ncbi:MAG: hypothetical protein FWF44_10645 [Defluviitaleaceae bacterium]|nr:hypothetical protein [Defluviitaleaceae bacterium]
MNEQSIPPDLAAALRALGVKGIIMVVLDYHPGIDRVSVNGQYFGLWDKQKKTFVD